MNSSSSASSSSPPLTDPPTTDIPHPPSFSDSSKPAEPPAGESPLRLLLPPPPPSPPSTRPHSIPPPREDCWSEGATWSLIDAWGERHRLVSGGSLRQKDWREVSEIVTSRENYTKPPKSESQCKNRIDTLKKKFKLESGKRSSSWPYLPRLRDLLLSSAPAASRDPGSFRHQMQHLQLKKKRSTKKRSHRKILENFALPPPSPPPPPPPPQEEEEEEEKKKKMSSTGIAELTGAIVKFGEVYERVESGKLKQAAELERQRMGLARELEMQRMEFFTKAFLELSRLKPTKPS